MVTVLPLPDQRSLQSPLSQKPIPKANNTNEAVQSAQEHTASHASDTIGAEKTLPDSWFIPLWFKPLSNEDAGFDYTCVSHLTHQDCILLEGKGELEKVSVLYSVDCGGRTGIHGGMLYFYRKKLGNKSCKKHK